MSESPRDQILKLRALIQRYEDKYRKEHAPEISDFEFDKLVDQLADLEREFPMFAGPDLGIGDDKSEGFQQADHKAPMLSLDNTYDEADFRAFGDRLYKALGGTGLEFIVEPKVDGVAVSLTFEKGQFVRAVTRGNGARGDDVTANVSLIREIPRTLKGAPDLLEVRGEIYMELAEFQRLNQLREAEGEPLYANPRNLAAGTVKLLDGEEARRRRLSIVCYGLGACEPASAFASLKEFKTKLKTWGFPIRDDIDVQQGVDAAWKAIQQLDVLRRDLPFPTDGAVVKVNRLEDQRRAGTTSKFPHWAVAFKFPPDQAETILRKISMQVGRTGAITPVAELDPVLLAGSTVARATLHNADEIARKDIREGDTVRIQKAGEIIPQVLGVVLEKRPAVAQPFDFEARLKELGLDAARDGEEAAYKLRAPSRDMKVRRLAYFASKHCLDIDGFGDALSEQVVDLGFVDKPTDLLSITDTQWLSIPEFGEKSLLNIKQGIAESKKSELWRVINCLGIEDVGIQTAKDLSNHFKSLIKLSEANESDFRTTLTKENGDKEIAYCIDNIAEKVAESIIGFFKRPGSRDEVMALKNAGYRIEEPGDSECTFIRSLSSENRLSYLRLKKCRSILETLKSFGIEGVNDRLAMKIVAYSENFTEMLKTDANKLASEIRAKADESAIFSLLEFINSDLGRKIILRSGAPIESTPEVYRYCFEQVQMRYMKILKLFDIGYGEKTTPEGAERKVRTFLRGEKWKSAALRLWEESQEDDIYKIDIESIQPGAAYAFEQEAKKRVEEQEFLSRSKSLQKLSTNRNVRELDLAQRALIPAGFSDLTARLLESNSAIETIKALDVERINDELILRLIAHDQEIFVNKELNPLKVCDELDLTPKRKDALLLLFEAIRNPEVEMLIKLTSATLRPTDEVAAYAVQRVSFYAQKCIKLLGLQDVAGLSTQTDAKILKEAVKSKPHFKYALELWQTANRTDINEIEIENLPEGGALQFEQEAIDRVPKKASLSDIEALKKLSSNKPGNLIVISGKVEGLNREEAKLAAEKLGYKVADGVTSAINILVIGDDPGPSKIKKALSYKIPVIPFSELKPYISS